MSPLDTTSSDTESRLVALCREMFAQRRLILASNRGPVEYAFAPTGGLDAQRGRGGLVTALSAISQYAQLTWVGCAMNDAERQLAAQAAQDPIPSPLPGQNMLTRFVVPSKSAYHRYYDIFSNPLLWFVQHYMWNSPYTPNVDADVYDAWHEGYCVVNDGFATAVIEEARREEQPPFVMLQDYHLYLAARRIRAEAPGVILQHFTHIPWPAPGYWNLLPRLMRREICESLCANDIVGFQTMPYVRNFLHTIQEVLPEAEVDYRLCTVWHEGHLTLVRPYPISIDVPGIRNITRTPRFREHRDRLAGLSGKQTIVRVDRVDPSKNIIRGFRAFDLLLRRRPELHGEIRFLAFLVPSRTQVREYQRYADEALALIRKINSEHGDDSWQPIELFYENNYVQALAGMSLADVLLVNAVIDGMNLVAKEGPIVNTRDAVLILSESVGAYEQLGKGALGVSPADVEGTCRALDQALTMPAPERQSRAETLRENVEREDLSFWLLIQLEDLARLV